MHVLCAPGGIARVNWRSMLMKLNRITLVLLLAVAGASAAAEQATRLTIHNRTFETVLSGVYTLRGGQRTQNWLASDLNPNQSAQRPVLEADQGCNQEIQIEYIGVQPGTVEAETILVDSCIVSEIFFGDRNVTLYRVHSVLPR